MEESKEPPIPTKEKKTHCLDPDAKSGERELLVLSINVRDRIIKVTVREKTDLNKLYDRIHLLGDFEAFPKKFRKIFIRFWQSLIDEAKEILRKKQGKDEEPKPFHDEP